MQQKRIIVDCMGGDRAPGEMLAGAVAAKAALGGEYLLVGVRAEMESAARARSIDLSAFELRDAGSVIGMEDDPMCVLHAKKDSSMAVALRALRDGEGDAVVSTGNTGALFTGASLIVRRMQGIHRAAIATVLAFEKPTLLMDSGANVTVQPDFLPQFAVMGSAYMKGLFGIEMPMWWCKGLFPSLMVLGLHYAPFAYILIGGIFRNMDANLEEAATILDTPKWKTMFRITLPMVKPAILSTILLVFGSAMGSYPVPHYLGLSTLSTKYVSMNSKYTGEASILAIIMMVFGVAIMLLNQLSLRSRKNYTTVTGKSGQISKITLGKTGRVVIALILVILTFFTSIFPIISFAFETFLPNPGDYSFLYTGDASNLTTKWWVTAENVTENGMYGQKGILYNETIWRAFKGTILVSVACALLAGSIGTMIGYAVSKNRRSRWANYVNSVAFLPYLMPSIAVGVAFFILFSTEKLNLFNTYTLLIIVGTVKYIPFASRSSLNSMLQLSGEIEEAAIIQDIPWIKRMTRIIIPIQKSSIISGFLLPFMTCLRELSLFMLLCVQGFILSTTLDYFDEMGLYAFSSGINLILIVTILVCNTLVNKITGASLDKGIGG